MDLQLWQLRAICTRAPASLLASVLAPLNLSMAAAEASTPHRAAHYLSQIAVESMEFQRLEENMNYSAEGLTKTWPRRFPTLDSASLLAHNPQAIGSAVYADRLGNGDVASGDGWKFRGRGWIAVTGCDSCRICGLYLGLDLVSHPELLATPDGAAKSAAWFWRTKGLNTLADAGTTLQAVTAVTRRVNGGLTGLAERLAYFDRALQAFGLPERADQAV